MRYIYRLIDPRNPEITRYIGCCADPKARLSGHLQSNCGSRKGRWVRSLLDDGVTPEIEILEQVQDDVEALEREAWHIRMNRGPELTNHTFNPSAGHKQIEAGPKTKRETAFSGLRAEIADKEREVILKALESNNNKIAPTARALGVSRPTLYEKINQLNIKR